jgi:hypothetical protein
MSPKFSTGAAEAVVAVGPIAVDPVAVDPVVAGAAAVPRPALVDGAELPAAAGPPRAVAVVDGAVDGEPTGFEGADADAPAGPAPACVAVAPVDAGVGGTDTVAGAGSGLLAVGAAAVGALLAGVVVCASVDVAGMTTVAGLRSTMNASTPPPTTSATTRMAALAR